MTNTTSDFGRELDSLADIVTFGMAPSLLALVWGFHFLPDSINAQLHMHLLQAGAFICFLFLLGGASRLARFNISHDPQPRNPGRPDRKYFVGMPIPAAAGLLAASVHLCYGIPNVYWYIAIPWLILVGLCSLSHGQHLALLVGQGDQSFPQPSLPAAVAAGARCLRLDPVFERRPCFWSRWCTCSRGFGRARRMGGSAAGAGVQKATLDARRSGRARTARAQVFRLEFVLQSAIGAISHADLLTR